jgi:hypothetical protein
VVLVVLTALFLCTEALFVVLTCLWTADLDWLVRVAVLEYRVLLRVAVAFFAVTPVLRLLYLGSPSLIPLTLPVVVLVL